MTPAELDTLDRQLLEVLAEADVTRGNGLSALRVRWARADKGHPDVIPVGLIGQRLKDLKRRGLAKEYRRGSDGADCRHYRILPKGISYLSREP